MRTLHRRTLATLVGSVSVLAACGGATDGVAESGVTLPPPAAEASASDPTLAPAPTDDAAPAPTAAPADEPTAAVAEQPVGTDAAQPVETDAAPATAAAAPATAAAAPATETPAPETPAPVEAVLGGRAFASDVTTASEVLPDLQVDDIRSGQKVNLRNVFPAERPVLFWMWAPH